MSRFRRTAAILCIAAALFAAFVPGIANLYCAILETGWVVLQLDVVVVRLPPQAPVSEQTTALLAVAPSRAPPAPQPLA